MSAKGKGTQGFRYYLSLLSGLCRGPINEVVEINVGDKQAWNGHACSNAVQNINAPDLFGGDDKEGGIQGPFAVYMGADDQVIPGASGGLPDLKGSIGGLVSEMRGVVTLWFDGMVAAMNPYLKTWKFRVRRASAGWYNDDTWYPQKATIYLGGNSLAVSTNSVGDFPIASDEDLGTSVITFSRNMADGDTFTINGYTITAVADTKDSDLGDGEFDPDKTIAKTVRKLANYINSKSTTYKALATYTADTITLTANKALQDIYAMNPSHIVYQCYTDPLWGRGLARPQLDENSFTYAANLFCNEGFGLALIWYRKEDIDVFIQKVCDLVGATTYTDRETGLIVFKPIRNDYVVADLPLFTLETGLLSILDDDSASADNSYNEIIGTSRDPISNLDFQVRAQNPAALQAQGAVSSLDQDYKGIPTKELLQRVVLRDLRAMASGLKRYTVTLDRRGWRLAPGGLFRISVPSRGLVNVVLRIAEIDDGDMLNGQIKIKAAIDVFGLPATTYQGISESGWVAPNKVAVPAPDERLVEASFRDLYRLRGASDAAAADPTSAYIGQLALAPNATSMEYDLLTRVEGTPEFTNRGRGIFTGNARLSEDITPLQTAIPINSLASFDAENIDEAILIDDELVRLDALDTGTGIATVTRGVGDTIPAPHDAGAVLWTIDDDLTPDGVDYVQGETAFSKVLTRTSSQVLDADLADEQEIELVGRHTMPYPPADVQVSGESIFEPRAENPEPVITWVERNRLTQADALTGYTEAGIAAEAGTTYTIRIYKGDTLLRTVADLTDLTWTYEPTMQDADAAGGTVLVELVSVRDGIESYQPYRFPIVLEGGWGYGWGYAWGGSA